MKSSATLSFAPKKRFGSSGSILPRLYNNNYMIVNRGIQNSCFRNNATTIYQSSTPFNISTTFVSKSQSFQQYKRFFKLSRSLRAETDIGSFFDDFDASSQSNRYFQETRNVPSYRSDKRLIQFREPSISEFVEAYKHSDESGCNSVLDEMKPQELEVVTKHLIPIIKKPLAKKMLKKIFDLDRRIVHSQTERFLTTNVSNTKLVQETLMELNLSNITLNSYIFQNIIQNLHDPVLARQYFHYMIQLNIVPTSKLLAIMIPQAGTLERIGEYKNLMKLYNITPNSEIYSSLISTCISSGDTYSADIYFTEAKKLNISPTYNFYLNLIQCCQEKHLVTKALDYAATMYREGGFNIGNQVFLAVIRCSYDVRSTDPVFAFMKETKFYPNGDFIRGVAEIFGSYGYVYRTIHALMQKHRLGNYSKNTQRNDWLKEEEEEEEEDEGEEIDEDQDEMEGEDEMEEDMEDDEDFEEEEEEDEEEEAKEVEAKKKDKRTRTF